VDGVDQASETHDSSPMLVVVENGNVANFLELLFDVEAVRCLDVLKINATECACNTLYTVDELVRILRVN